MLKRYSELEAKVETAQREFMDALKLTDDDRVRDALTDLQSARRQLFDYVAREVDLADA